MNLNIINMKLFLILTVFTLGLTLTSCEYNPDQPDSAYNGKEDWPYDLNKYEGLVPEGYSLARISEINTGKDIDKKYRKESGDIWSINFYGLGSLNAGYLNLPKSKAKKLGLHKRDVIAVSKDGKDIKKLPVYLKPKPEKKGYDPQKMNEAYGGKTLKELVPDWTKYPFEKKVYFVRIERINVATSGTFNYTLHGPTGYIMSISYIDEDALEKEWHLGDVIKVTFRDSRPIVWDKETLEKVNEYNLIPSAEWQNMKNKTNSQRQTLQNALDGGPYPVNPGDYK
jgi:hypothetical protein